MTAPAARPWNRAWREGALVWLAAHLGHLAILLVSRRADKTWMGLPSALRTFRQQDSNWYLSIASHGYEAHDSRITAFFPAYPLLARLLDPVLPGHTEAALFIGTTVALL